VEGRPRPRPPVSAPRSCQRSRQSLQGRPSCTQRLFSDRPPITSYAHGTGSWGPPCWCIRASSPSFLNSSAIMSNMGGWEMTMSLRRRVAVCAGAHAVCRRRSRRKVIPPRRTIKRIMPHSDSAGIGVAVGASLQRLVNSMAGMVSST